MPLLRCAGVFAVPVPGGWEVFGVLGESYLLVPPGGRGGEIRLAPYPRAAGPLGEREGADRLVDLLGEFGVDPGDEGVVCKVRYSDAAHRAFAWFPGRDDSGREIDVLVAVVVLPDVVVAATAMAGVRQPRVILEAEILLGSLGPDTEPAG